MYEFDARTLKNKDRRRTLAYSLFSILAELVVLALLFIKVSPFSIFGYVVASFTVLPTPFVKIPETYRIDEDHIVDGRGRRLLPGKTHRVYVNRKRSFVSISHRFRGEYLRLYTDDVEKVQTQVQSIISQQ